MKKPIHLEYLKKGDLIAVVSIAKYIKNPSKMNAKIIKKYIHNRIENSLIF